MAYFNYSFTAADTYWERATFTRHWWRIYAGDPRWVPPYYPDLRRELDPTRNNHLVRLRPVLWYSEARVRRQPRPGSQAWAAEPMFEPPVIAAVALYDSRRRDRTAYLALLHAVNDPEPLERLLERLAESLGPLGCRRLIGPTGLSPHLETGLLRDCWDRLPPLSTPYDPPYLPEIAAIHLQPLAQARLYHLAIPPEPPPVPSSPAEIAPLEPARLAGDLLALMVAACPAWAGFPPPDEQEAAFILRWLSRWPLYGWLALVDTRPVGFVLLQPDLGSRLKRAGGGRNPLWRPWLLWAGRRPARQGRLLYGAVLPDWGGQGIGRQLLRQALVTSHSLGWQRLSCGPLPDGSTGSKFLEHHGATAEQKYTLYQREL